MTCTYMGRRLRALAPAFASRQAATTFGGYLIAQKQRLIGERGQLRVNRPELVARYGFDTKYAGHMIRLGYQGVEYLTTGRLTLPMRPAERERVVAIRSGQVPLQEVLTETGGLEERLKDLASTSSLPPEGDVAAVNRFLVETYRELWG